MISILDSAIGFPISSVIILACSSRLSLKASAIETMISALLLKLSVFQIRYSSDTLSMIDSTALVEYSSYSLIILFVAGLIDFIIANNLSV